LTTASREHTLNQVTLRLDGRIIWGRLEIFTDWNVSRSLVDFGTVE